MLTKIKNRQEIKLLRYAKLTFIIMYWLAMIMSGIIHEEFPPPPLRDSPNATNYTNDMLDLNSITNVTVIKNMTTNILRSDSIPVGSDAITDDSSKSSNKISEQIEKFQHGPDELEAIQKNKAD